METDELFQLGSTAYAAGEYQHAVQFLKEGLKTAPTTWKNRLLLAMALSRCGNNREARLEFQYIRDFCKDVELAKKAMQADQALSTISTGK